MQAPLGADHSPAFGFSPAIAPQLTAQPSSVRPQRVLVLEDDALQLELLEAHLAEVQLQVATARTVAEARKRLQQERVDLAILDIQLPDGCGLDLCDAIDADPCRRGLPIMVLSSVRERDVIRRTRAAGGAYFLAKPYDPKVLLSLVEALLSEG
ncbi:MAG: hypothetical protein KatS3mg111_4201 [Pirellulaceae bacterium]|nr:MAG: hypothetical protein KatS3mg111_4201 [Pirellulaceae bacterium]